MVTRTLSDDGREHTYRSSPRSSKLRSRKTSIKWAKLPIQNHPRGSMSHISESTQENAIRVPGHRSSSSGSEPAIEDESPRSSAYPSTGPPLSNIKFERRRSLGADPYRDREESGTFQRGRRRYSFAVGHDADEGLAAETWQILVDDEERREAAQLIEGDQTAYDPDQYELQSIVAALFDKNAALRNEIANIKADTTEARRQKALRHRRFLSVKMPGLLDKYDQESDDDAYLEQQMEKDIQIHRLQETRDVDQTNIKGHFSEQSKNTQEPQLDGRTYGSSNAIDVGRAGQSSTARQQIEQLPIRQRSQPDDEASSAASDAVTGGPLPRNEERTIELQRQLDDLIKRHNASRQENLELKKKSRAIQAERDKFKFENFKLQRTRSDAQYEKLREQYRELQEQTQELLRQRQELLDMSNEMALKLPAFRALQTKNLRENQIYWEHERIRAGGPSLGQIAEEESSSSIDTLRALTQHRTGPVRHATPLDAGTTATGTENLSDAQTGSMSSDKIDVAAADIIALRSRQGSTAPLEPGRGLEESRKNGPSPLKQRPGSIIHPTRQVRGLPKQATRGSPSYHRVRDLMHPHVTRSLTEPSSQITDTDTDPRTSADYSGRSDAVHTANQIEIAHMTSHTPSNATGNLAWRNTDSQKYEDQNSPLSGLTDLFELIKGLPSATHSRGMIKFDIRSSDESYNLHEFKRGDQIFVHVDGMQDFWPVKLSEDPKAVIYVLPRTAIALICDHGQEYTEMYAVVKNWPEQNTHRAKPGYLAVVSGEFLHCAHSTNDTTARKGEAIQVWRCMKSQDGQRNGLVPAKVLQKLNTFVAPPSTASLCACADPQPYTDRARLLVDYDDPLGQLSLKEGTEVEVSHLDANLGRYCVRDPKNKKRGFIHALCLRFIRNPVCGPKPEGGNKHVLDLTPRFFDFMHRESKDMETKEHDVKEAMKRPKELDGISDEARRRWEQNLDGTNPQHKKFDEGMLGRGPDGNNFWTRWREKGLPPLVGHYVLRDDLNTIKEGKQYACSDLNELDWKLFVNTFPFNPLGPNTGTHRARARSLPTLRNPAHLNEKEQEREGLVKKSLHIGHQPHRNIADGICPDRDYMSEPVTGEPHDLKRRYIYFRDDGTMLACEAETETNVHDIDLWKTIGKGDRQLTAWRRQGLLQKEPAKEAIDPFSCYYSAQNSGKVDSDPLDVFRGHQKYGFDLVYRLKRDPSETPVLAMHGISADDRFEIIHMPGPEMRSVEGRYPAIAIRRVKTKIHTDTTPNESTSAEHASADRGYWVSSSVLDPMPFLRTAFFKDESTLDCLMPQERDQYRFVLIRKSIQGSNWDGLYGGKIVPTKLSKLELEDTKLWKSLESVLGKIQLAYHQKDELDALNKGESAEHEPDPTVSAPHIEDWDFWYPVVCGLTGFGNGFVDIEGPDLASGQPVDYVQILPNSENKGTYMCVTKYSKQTGLVHANAIDLREPCLPMFTLLAADATPTDSLFLLLKKEKANIFISLDDHGKGWISSHELSFDEDECHMVPLSELFEKGILDIDDVEGAVVYMENLYKNEPIGTLGTSKSGFVHDAGYATPSQGMASSPSRRSSRQRPLLSDSSGPPTSLYCPRPIREAGSAISAAPNTKASTGPKEIDRFDHHPDNVTQPTRRTLPREIGETRIGSGDNTQQPEGSTSTSANNSSMSMINLPLLGLGEKFVAPEIPVQTKPNQHANRTSSSASKFGNGSDIIEPDAEEVTGKTTVGDPNGNGLLIRYDDWVQREEAFKDDTSTSTGQSRSNRLRESCSVVRDGIDQNDQTVPDRVAHNEHGQLRRTSSHTRASHLSQPGIRTEHPNENWHELNSGRQAKRRRSENDLNNGHGLGSFGKRARSTSKSVSDRILAITPSTRKIAAGSEEMSFSHQTSGLAEEIIRDLPVDIPEIPVSRSSIISYYERPPETAKDVNFIRFPSLYGVEHSSPSRRGKSKSDHPGALGDPQRSPTRGPSVPGSRWTSIFDSNVHSSSPRGGWSGSGQVQSGNRHDSPNSVRSSPRRTILAPSNGPDVRNLVPRATTETTGASTALQKLVDARGSGLRLVLDEDENTGGVSPSDVTGFEENTDGANTDNISITPIQNPTPNAYRYRSELAGSAVPPTRIRSVSRPAPCQEHQGVLPTNPIQTILSISPTDSLPRADPIPHPRRQPLSQLPVRTTRLTISPVRSSTYSNLETAVPWLHEKLTLVMKILLSLSNPTSTSTVREPEVEVPEMGRELRRGVTKTKPSRWSLLYLLILGYLLFSIWLARGEWLDANGLGGTWGVHAVRGAHGRWVWGLYTG